MHMRLISQRSSRSFLPAAIFFTLCILWVTTSRLRNGSRLPQATIRVGDYRKSLDKENDQIPWHDGPTKRPKLGPGQCSSDVDFLRRPELGLTDNILYTRRCIKPIRGKVDRNVLTNLSTPLVDTTRMTPVNLTSCSRADLPPCEPLSLHVPKPYPQKQYPHLIFGVASDCERMQNSINTFAHWLSGSGAHLHAIIVDGDEPRRGCNLTLLEDIYREQDILATFVAPSAVVPHTLNPQTSQASSNHVPDDHHEQPIQQAPIEHYHFLLVRYLLVTHSSPSIHWLALIDDDTFFPSLYPLSQALSQHDHGRPQWLGALSDDFSAITRWGFMAFGGAGVFLSLPLAEQIAPHTDECLAQATINTGDGILRDCIYTHTRAKLTVVEGLYQHDIRGDVSGWFESGVGPLSIHHWKSWYKEPVVKMAAVGRLVCGRCWLQRWRFAGGGGGRDMLLANGYSITEYPVPDSLEGKDGTEEEEEEDELIGKGKTNKKKKGGLDYIDLGRIEGTWLHPTQEYDFSYGPLRPKLGEDRKKSWKLVDVNVEVAGAGAANGGEDGGSGASSSGGKEDITTFRQIYVHRKSDAWEVDEGAVDEVIELIWEV